MKNRYEISKHPYLDNYYQVYDNYQCRIVYVGSLISCKRYSK